MKKQVAFLLTSLSLLTSACGVEQPADNEANQLLDQASADESFRATVSWLAKAKDIQVDLGQGVVEHKEGATRLTFALPSEEVSGLSFEVRPDGSTRVYTNERLNEEPEDRSAQAACGRYVSSDSCTTGPYSTGEYCANNAPLYAYTDYTRETYQYGRKVFHKQSWKSCQWTAQSTTCTNTCS
ncbi:hypothetical protein D187_008980 [Cystobacter fuscus DSM 2262]|uniref:Lipoprotein n=1 Tax=Cystobacter fuscus (strain ATCC 25194 / DSM 2262 / NBRC 100088 / M29) TaxID=1242864 RepID=S9PK11_CYSF2|nr:hypothetical protein [Cystobacter fuscus]EPX62792.1 hypothetical protein D187_008980 [Cystobacter fuscus DSM 2262]